MNDASPPSATPGTPGSAVPGELTSTVICTGEWIVVNDDVMGGVSRSTVTCRNGIVHFSGDLSLAHSGGFAATRTTVSGPPRGLAGFSFVARGDGRRYQFRVRPDRRFDGVAWRAHFLTRPDEWCAVTVGFEALEPVYRGRLVHGAPALGARQIGQLGFLLADRQSGPFHLEVRDLRYRLRAEPPAPAPDA